MIRKRERETYITSQVLESGVLHFNFPFPFHCLMASLAHQVAWILLWSISQMRELCHSIHRSLVCTSASAFRPRPLGRAPAPAHRHLAISFLFSLVPSACFFRLSMAFSQKLPFFHGFLPLALSPISLSVPLQAFSTPPWDLREILSAFRFENVFSLHPQATPTVAKRPGNFDEDGPCKTFTSRS